MVADLNNNNQTSSEKNQTSIQRSLHDRRNPYAQINRSLLQNTKLTWGARGLLAYLLSLPDDWKISMVHLVTQAPEGKDAVRSLFRILESEGYATREKFADPIFPGLVRERWIISEEPRFKKFLPDAGFPTPDEPTADDPPVLKKESTKEIYTKKEIPLKGDKERNDADASAAAKAAPFPIKKKPLDKIKFQEHVFLTKEEYEKLMKKFGEAGTKHRIEKLNAYVGSKNKRYASHYHTILAWDLRDAEEAQKKASIAKKAETDRPSGISYRVPKWVQDKFDKEKLEKERKNEQ